MDASIRAAGAALRTGDPLGALKRVALRGDPPALALRGIALAQLGDLARARELLRSAARGFGSRDVLARARCRTAEAEVAFAARDLAWAPQALAEALRTFVAHGDRENAAHARLLLARRLLLLGRVEAAAACAAPEVRGASARHAAVAALVAFEVALRRGRASEAKAALARAREAAARSGIAALRAEVEHAGRALVLPAARLVDAGAARALTLAEVAEVLSSPDLIVDGCRRAVRRGGREVRLARRPALFALLSGLAEAWPGEALRASLIARVFEARRPNESHRARLRVAIGRLRRVLQPVADVRATAGGFRLAIREGATVRVLAPPIETPDAGVLALLADGEAWSTSSLALALGESKRSVQRALGALAEAGQVRALGRGRSQRWLCATLAGFTTTLLLPAAEPPG